MFIPNFRRRREQKTDYRNRLALIKSNKTRLVVRRTLENISVQFINYGKGGDATVASAFSHELKKYGWKYSTGNIPAAYLTGFLAGMKAKHKVKDAILDLGLHISTKGSRIYAALKGVVDSGLNVSHSADIFPSEDRIKGVHINKEMKNEFENIKNKISAIK